MTKADKRTLLIVIAVFAVVMIAIFWDYVSYAAHKTGKAVSGSLDKSDDAEAQPGSSMQPGNLNLNLLLKKGVYNSQEVKMLQQLMNQVQPGKISEDGDFGPATEKKLYELTGKKQITLQQAYDMLQNLFQ